MPADLLSEKSGDTKTRWALNNGMWTIKASSVEHNIGKANAYTFDGTGYLTKPPRLVLAAQGLILVAVTRSQGLALSPH
ncbi:hypothetical protein ACIQUL_30055 [Streptomyces sp. NPDC090303]|uniref:hypothetical protein n=1 Tax=Streptomyces sp. NPDC090303 TaxID=3365960 RepID=UPI00381C064F